MPLEINIPYDEKSIELDEYIDILESQKYNLSSHEDIIDSAKYLNQLNNNKRFLINRMCDELKDMGTFQQSNLYGPQVFLLHSTDRYFLRAVVWNPITKVEKAIPNFKYDICHDHNFDILTIGYCGPGYESRCYTYTHEEVKGFLGEKVAMNAEGTFTLSKGKLMLYRGKKDIHIQLPPSSLSISLNLIPRSEKINQPQFQFDESTHQICRYLHSSGTELFVRMAGLLEDPSMIDSLDSIYTHNPSPHIKAFAAQAMIQILPDLKEDIVAQVYKTSNPLVTDIFEKESIKYGSSLGMHSL